MDRRLHHRYTVMLAVAVGIIVGIAAYVIAQSTAKQTTLDETTPITNTVYGNGFCIVHSNHTFCSSYIVIEGSSVVSAVRLSVGNSSLLIPLPGEGISFIDWLEIEVSIQLPRGPGILLLHPNPYTVLTVYFNCTSLAHEITTAASTTQLVTVYNLTIPSGSVSSVELNGVYPNASHAYYIVVKPSRKNEGMIDVKLFLGQDRVAWERITGDGIDTLVVPLGGVLRQNRELYYTRLTLVYESSLDNTTSTGHFKAMMYASRPLMLDLDLLDGSSLRLILPIATPPEPASG
ncbi:hypothetical protein [Pyrodictium delaneyi]|uniref:Uncharacterized protein n=1 Tax=Pyrodictium delaneyi TaxID=1273541 RepID=A0A211YQE1_9CREN|nr:hypothetical protein [Pyrodictium delaneyi]OWJ55171.1 hypothetical protein Pdsh_05725 [Pyrodictium delaneyi]